MTDPFCYWLLIVNWHKYFLLNSRLQLFRIGYDRITYYFCDIDTPEYYWSILWICFFSEKNKSIGFTNSDVCVKETLPSFCESENFDWLSMHIMFIFYGFLTVNWRNNLAIFFFIEFPSSVISTLICMVGGRSLASLCTPLNVERFFENDSYGFHRPCE